MKLKRAFTLIELLVVIGIIGILASIILASLSTAKAKGRDARRAADVKQLQQATENYFEDNSAYPDSLSSLSPFLTSVPVDPLGTAYAYEDNSSNNSYCIGANFELGVPASLGPTATCSFDSSFNTTKNVNYVVQGP